MKSYYYFLFACLSFSLGSCQTQKEKPSPPNILFAIADDASWLHFGAYGCDWVNTPGFDRVAAEGILFNRAYTPNAKCAPSRACILTGRNSWQLEEAVNHWPYFPDRFITYAEVLKAAGYHTGFTTKGWAPGIVGQVSGKKRELLGKRYNEQTLEPPTKAINKADYTANFEAFLTDRSPGQAFCFWYGSTEPHRRYEYGTGASVAGKKIEDIDKVPSFWPDNETVRNDMLDYALEIEYFDQHLVKMIDILEKNGELDNTIIVVTADNGMPFPRIKGQKYEYSNHLPLAIMWGKGIKNPGRVVDDYVNFIDFAPTFLEYAGVNWEDSGMAEITGKSLGDIFSSSQDGLINPERDHILIGKERHDVGRPQDQGYPVRGIVKDNYLYVHNFETDRWPAGNPETGYLNCDGSPTKTILLEGRRDGSDVIRWEQNFGKRPQKELYKVDEDPECMINLANDPSMLSLKETMQAKLFAALEAQGDLRILGNGESYEAFQYQDTKTQGFYERFMAGEALKAGWVNPGDFEKEKLD